MKQLMVCILSLAVQQCRFVVSENALTKENACGEISDLSQMQSFPFEDILLKKEATKMQMYQMKLYYLCCKNLMMKHEDIIWFPLCWNSSKGYMTVDQNFKTVWQCSVRDIMKSEVYAFCSENVDNLYYAFEKISFCYTPSHVRSDIASVIIFLLAFIFLFILILFFVGKDRTKY
ncbi:uncharacterized protein LOC142338252 isoform X2 [Convolutriloba macropyga]|uniref:uncharacterized protein LOC142338252 isoform X2 n=1 Tax=Convolutriloba macropyga TaxID=536237 RepID=UPI003F51C6D6